MSGRGARTPLTAEQENEIRELADEGVPITTIAKKFHIGAVRAQRIIAGGSQYGGAPVRAPRCELPPAQDKGSSSQESEHFVSFRPSNVQADDGELERELAEHARPVAESCGATSDDESDADAAGSGPVDRAIFDEDEDDDSGAEDESEIDLLAQELDEGLALLETGVDDPIFVDNLRGIAGDLLRAGSISRGSYNKVIARVLTPRHQQRHGQVRARPAPQKGGRAPQQAPVRPHVRPNERQRPREYPPAEYDPEPPQRNARRRALPRAQLSGGRLPEQPVRGRGKEPVSSDDEAQTSRLIIW